MSASQLTAEVTPDKDTTDNLDGTVSGGRLTVLFDDSSTPAITALGGAFFAIPSRDRRSDTKSTIGLAPVETRH